MHATWHEARDNLRKMHAFLVTMLLGEEDNAIN